MSHWQGKQALNPEEDAKGALQAARKINPDANTQVIGEKQLHKCSPNSSIVVHAHLPSFSR